MWRGKGGGGSSGEYLSFWLLEVLKFLLHPAHYFLQLCQKVVFLRLSNVPSNLAEIAKKNPQPSPKPIGEGRGRGTLSHTARTCACLSCNHINLLFLGKEPKNSLNLIIQLEGCPWGMNGRLLTENPPPTTLGKLALLLLRSWEEMEKLSIALDAQFMAPGVQQTSESVFLPVVCANTSWNVAFRRLNIRWLFPLQLVFRCIMLMLPTGKHCCLQQAIQVQTHHVALVLSQNSSWCMYFHELTWEASSDACSFL